MNSTLLEGMNKQEGNNPVLVKYIEFEGGYNSANKFKIELVSDQKRLIELSKYSGFRVFELQKMDLDKQIEFVRDAHKQIELETAKNELAKIENEIKNLTKQKENLVGKLEELQ